MGKCVARRVEIQSVWLGFKPQALPPKIPAMGSQSNGSGGCQNSRFDVDENASLCNTWTYSAVHVSPSRTTHSYRLPEPTETELYMYSPKHMEIGSVVEEGCCTPNRGIPARTAPPPPPRKKPLLGGKRKSPKNGYFHPPDLDQLFVALRRPEAACV